MENRASMERIYVYTIDLKKKTIKLNEDFETPLLPSIDNLNTIKFKFEVDNNDDINFTINKLIVYDSGIKETYELSPQGDNSFYINGYSIAGGYINFCIYGEINTGTTNEEFFTKNSNNIPYESAILGYLDFSEVTVESRTMKNNGIIPLPSAVINNNINEENNNEEAILLNIGGLTEITTNRINHYLCWDIPNTQYRTNIQSQSVSEQEVI